MSTITMSGSPGLRASHSMKARVIGDLTTGSAITNGEALRLASTGYVYQACSSASTNHLLTSQYAGSAVYFNLSDFIGFAPESVASGDKITAYGAGARIKYASDMTPGTLLYVSATGGSLDDSPAIAGDLPVAIVVSATDIAVLR